MPNINKVIGQNLITGYKLTSGSTVHLAGATIILADSYFVDGVFKIIEANAVTDAVNCLLSIQYNSQYGRLYSENADTLLIADIRRV